MNNDPHDYSSEDDGVDEDMMFEFEEELSTRLTLRDVDRTASRADGARSPFVSLAGDLGDSAQPPFSGSGFAADSLTATATVPIPLRPQNPVAFVLDSANDAEDATFASLSASPFGAYSSAAVGSMSMAGPPAMSDKPPSFDFNGRRKRKYSDDSCCGPLRVRPTPKRAKSFSCVRDVLLPDCGFKSISSTSFVPCVVETKPSAIVTSTPSAAASTTTTHLFSLSSRSKSIQIPHRDRASAAHRSVAFHHQRSSSGPARGTTIHGTRLLDAPAASSDPLNHQASSSWNASVEYFCRRSLDISSPLRTRFRDLVVGSVGRAGGLKSP